MNKEDFNNFQIFNGTGTAVKEKPMTNSKLDRVAEAIEMYLKATTKEEEQEATNLIDKVNEKYNHELPNDFYNKYTVDELRKLLEWAETTE